jgi:hypothetical protein
MDHVSFETGLSKRDAARETQPFRLLACLRAHSLLKRFNSSFVPPRS